MYECVDEIIANIKPNNTSPTMMAILTISSLNKLMAIKEEEQIMNELHFFLYIYTCMI